MTSQFKIKFDPPISGWMGITLESQHQHLAFLGSYVSLDQTEPVTKLVESLNRLFWYAEQETVSWLLEPIIYEWHFRVSASIMKFTVVSRDTQEILFEIEDTQPKLSRIFWRALRQLQSIQSPEAYHTAWGHEFPITVLGLLGQEIKSRN